MKFLFSTLMHVLTQSFTGAGDNLDADDYQPFRFLAVARYVRF